MQGMLYLVATPIGNLQDISQRALETLKTVDIIACEDTRHTGKLLKHFSITGKLVSYHEHNEEKRAEEFAKLLQIGKSIAIVSDAGTPGIADPSFRIVQKAHETGTKITVIPGAVAFTNAVVVSGLPTDSIFFGGFLPPKKGERRKRLEEVCKIPATLVFYETPHRIAKSINDCVEVLGNRKACVVRELTKIHEEIVCDNLEELRIKFSAQKTKGEIVLIIDREIIEDEELKEMREKFLPDRVQELENEGHDHKKALKLAAKEFGMSKSSAYKIMLQSKS